MILDDLKKIHDLDVQDALGIAEKQYAQLLQKFDVTVPQKEYKNIVVAGMGGSALAAMLSVTWPGYDIPFEICRGYTIPRYVGPDTLFVASSYSGNTEETLEALGQAEERGATIVVVTSGGKLLQRAHEKNYPLAKLPPKFQPRHMVLDNFKALMDVFCSAGVVDAAHVQQELERTAEFLHSAVEWWRPDVPVAHNYPKQIAQELMGRSMVIYGGTLMWPAAYKWKISFNENAKNVAWCNFYPEFNHNEFLGWTSHPIDKPYGIVNLRSNFEHTRIQKRFEISDRLLSGRRPAPLDIHAEGETIFQQLLWQVAIGDFVTIYTAIINGINPTPVELIERLKVELNA